MKVAYAQDEEFKLWYWAVRNDDNELLASSGKGELLQSDCEKALKSLAEELYRWLKEKT